MKLSQSVSQSESSHGKPFAQVCESAHERQFSRKTAREKIESQGPEASDEDEGAMKNAKMHQMRALTWISSPSKVQLALGQSQRADFDLNFCTNKSVSVSTANSRKRYCQSQGDQPRQRKQLGRDGPAENVVAHVKISQCCQTSQVCGNCA